MRRLAGDLFCQAPLGEEDRRGSKDIQLHDDAPALVARQPNERGHAIPTWDGRLGAKVQGGGATSGVQWHGSGTWTPAAQRQVLHSPSMAG